jgi:pimeloyl-ACP methyl ester carboxylesterase
VLVLPGLVASDNSTRELRTFLKSRGYAVSGWRQGGNLGLRHGVQDAIVDLVQELNDTRSRKVSLVVWSLGDLYARQLAKMMPERVRGVITLGSPFAATNAWRVASHSLNQASLSATAIASSSSLRHSSASSWKRSASLFVTCA